MLLDEGAGPLLGVAADLADHHDRVGLRVFLERLQAVDVRGPDDRVAADADRGGEADVAQLVHHLVGQRARLGDQADATGADDGERQIEWRQVFGAIAVAPAHDVGCNQTTDAGRDKLAAARATRRRAANV